MSHHIVEVRDLRYAYPDGHEALSGILRSASIMENPWPLLAPMARANPLCSCI